MSATAASRELLTYPPPPQMQPPPVGRPWCGAGPARTYRVKAAMVDILALAASTTFAAMFLVLRKHPTTVPPMSIHKGLLGTERWLRRRARGVERNQSSGHACAHPPARRPAGRNPSCSCCVAVLIERRQRHPRERGTPGATTDSFSGVF